MNECIYAREVGRETLPEMRRKQMPKSRMMARKEAKKAPLTC